MGVLGPAMPFLWERPNKAPKSVKKQVKAGKVIAPAVCMLPRARKGQRVYVPVPKSVLLSKLTRFGPCGV